MATARETREQRRQKFLDEISKSEGATWNTIVGGGTFNSFDDHPRRVGFVGPEGPSTAAGAYQITKSTYDDLRRRFPTQFGPGFTPDVQRAMAEQLISDKKGAWEAVDAGDFDTAKQLLRNTWTSFQKGSMDAAPAPRMMGGPPAGSPPPGLYPRLPQIAQRELELEKIQQDMSTALSEPYKLARVPVAPERGMAAVALPSLFSNLATAISGNPLYQQSFMNTMGMEDEQRRADREENLQLDRAEVQQRRMENLQGIAARLKTAEQRLIQEEQYEQALVMAEKHDRTLERIAKMQTDAQRDVGQMSADSRLMAALARAGMQVGTDAEGNPTIIPGAIPRDLSREDRLTAIEGLQKIAGGENVKKEERARAGRRIQMLTMTPDKDDRDWAGFEERVKRELPEMGPITPDALAVQLMSLALEYSGELEGAAEAYEAMQQALNVPAPTTEPPPAGGGGFLEDFFTTSPEEATRIRERQAGMRKAASGVKEAVGKGVTAARDLMMGKAAQRTVSPDEAAEQTVQHFQNNVDILLKVVRANPQVDSTAALADAYRKLEKARKDLETIRLKGRSPAKQTK